MGGLDGKDEITMVSTHWVIQCVINNARIAYQNFLVKKLPRE